MTDLADLAGAYASINAKIEELQEAKESIRDQIITLAGGFGTKAAGNLKVQIRHNRRLNQGRLIEAYPADEFPDLYKPTPDTTALKRYIAPAALEEFYDEGAPVVVVS